MRRVLNHSITADEYELLKHDLYHLSNDMSRYARTITNERIVRVMHEVNCCISDLVKELNLNASDITNNSRWE